MTKTIDIPMGRPYPQRVKLLGELRQQRSVHTYPLAFQGKTQYFSVYTVDLDLPKYRLSNGRTQAAQEEYLAKYPGLGADFFTRDQESGKVQLVQHGLLWEMVKNSSLLRYFVDLTHSQEQPLILSDKGFVVNGNLRLCALRELYYGDQKKYSRYSHIEVVVLPVCDERDLDELEAYLQIQPDIKQDYTWIAMSCMLRARQNRYGYTHEQLESLYGLPKGHVKARLAQLELADHYLTSRGLAKQYERVEQAEFAFKQLVKGRRGLKEADERDLFTELVYCLLDDSKAAGARLYERIPDVKESIQEIAHRLNQDLELKQDDSKTEIDYSVFGIHNSASTLEPLVNAVTETENRELVVEIVLDVVDGQKELERQRTRANAVLKQISEANAHLKNALNYIDEDASRLGVEEQLQAIEQSIRAIREWLAENA